MKQFIQINVNGYQIWGKTIRLRSYLRDYGRHFSMLKPVRNFQNKRKEVVNKLILDFKNHENIYFGQRFSSNSKERNLLMNFNVQIFPDALKSLRNMYYFMFVMKSIDKSFTIMEFNECSITALEVVTFLLSQLRFSELEGLLTRNCKEELENNLKTWPKQQLSALAVFPHRTLRCIPIDINVTKGVEDNEKTLVEITWAYYVWLKHEPEFDDESNYLNLSALFMYDYQRLSQSEESGMYESGRAVSNFKTLHMAAVYNSKFIREFRSGVDDQWTINAINCKCFPKIRAYL